MTAQASSRRNSLLIAAAIAIAFGVWLLSGIGGGLPEAPERPGAGGETAMRVTVERSRATEMTRRITASARTQPDRAIELKAETEGRVIAVGVERGAAVAAGETIVRLDMRDREALLEETEALIRQRELEYEAAEQLRGEQFMSAAELAATRAALVAARAARERIVLDIARTGITAPFDAVVQDRLVEIGDYVGIGDPIAELVDVDPLIVAANVNEREIGALTVGDRGTARILGNPEIEGTVRYLAPAADEATRSFRVELAIPNPDRQLRVGTSAELVLGAERIKAHEVSSAVLALSLADDGTIGVKIVDANDRVRFVPVEIVDATSTGSVLVTGLPNEARIITVGQGFVTEGQSVIPDEAPSAGSEPVARDERAY